MDWASLISAYLQYQAADKAGDQKPQYSISPQMKELFDLMMGSVKYDPTRDYVSSYADSFLKSQNAPGGAMSWKPTFQSDYMKNQQPLPNTALDLSKIPIMQGDAAGKMPWNYGYSGPGIGGKPTDWSANSSTGSGGPGGMIQPGNYNPAYTTGQGGMGWQPRNNNTGDDRGPGNVNIGGLPSTHGALPGPPNPADGQATWDAIRSGLATIGKNGELIWKATGAVIGYLIMGPMGVPIGVKAGGQVYTWTNNKPGANAPKPGGPAGAGGGAGNVGGRP